MAAWIVVEDEPDLYDMVLAMYESLGIEGVAFISGEEAVNWIDDVDSGHYEGSHPELALLDIRLPGELTGIDVGSRLRTSKSLKNIAIVLMTAYRLSPKEEAAAIAQAGADLLLYKPLPSMPQFQAMLQRLAASRQS
jgi:CheY-like chemotaxis protein